MKKFLVLLALVSLPLVAIADDIVEQYRGITTLGNAETLSVKMKDNVEFRMSVGTIAAAGSDETDATAIADQLTYVTAADASKGVILPASTGSGAIYVIHNNSAASVLKLYPDTTGQINGGTATTGDVAVAAEETAIMIDVATNVWYGGVAVDF